MELKLPAPCLIILVGPSGAGKSTWATEHFAAAEVVSSDALRAMVGAGEDDQTASTAAFEILDQIVAERMRRRLTTIVDTLGFDMERRKRWVSRAHEHDVPVHAVVFDTPADLCEERNAISERPVPKTILRRQISRFSKVVSELANEPFDGVHTQRPIALVTPAILSTTPPDGPLADREVRAAHTFGLTVSRFNWGDGDLGLRLAETARRAEAVGFRDLWVMDHFRQIPGVGRRWEDIPEAYVALSYVAGATKTIRLGALVTAITHRHPVVLGKMIATLDVLSAGRAICGLGVAWDHKEHAGYGIEFPSLAQRYTLLEETLQMLPLLWGKGTPSFSGELIKAPELICYPRPIQDPIPIMIGGSGETKTLPLVAKYGDACNLFGDPEKVRHKVSVLERHCAEVNRDPADIEVTHLITALVAADREALRARVSRLRDRNTTAEDFMRRSNAGTVEDLTDLFGTYGEAGARHSIVAIPDVAEEGSIEAFGDVIANLSSP